MLISRSLVLRGYLKDRIFVLLFSITVVTYLTAVLNRQPSIEASNVPFDLTSLFSGVNVLFAVLSLRREPLLAYMFLTATILIAGTLIFFFRYLASV